MFATRNATAPPVSTGISLPSSDFALTADEAKAKALAHLKYVDTLAKRRFPRDENLALEASQYVLEQLQSDDWKRLRSWKGQGDFLPFMATITARLLTDFFRSKRGYIRKPRWLEEKNDMLWHLAYQLAVVEQWPAREAVEQLVNYPPPRGRGIVEEVVRTVIGRCREQPRLTEAVDGFEVESLPDHAATEDCGEPQHKELIEVFLSILDSGQNDPVHPRVAEIAARLNPYLSLTDEDCLLLKLYYLEEMSMEAIKRLLKLEGDLYKRVKKLIAHVRTACQKAGLLVGHH
jgi:hypothetical protein